MISEISSSRDSPSLLAACIRSDPLKIFGRPGSGRSGPLFDSEVHGRDVAQPPTSPPYPPPPFGPYGPPVLYPVPPPQSQDTLVRTILVLVIVAVALLALVVFAVGVRREPDRRFNGRDEPSVGGERERDSNRRRFHDRTRHLVGRRRRWDGQPWRWIRRRGQRISAARRSLLHLLPDLVRLGIDRWERGVGDLKTNRLRVCGRRCPRARDRNTCTRPGAGSSTGRRTPIPPALGHSRCSSGSRIARCRRRDRGA